MQRSQVSAWQELSAMYEQADELQGTALDVWLAQHERAGHAQLPALRRMLAAREHLRGSGFLEILPRLAGVAVPAVSEAVGAGADVGPYRLLRPLGAGGMAEVWLAERSDGAFQRRVAIKLMFRQVGAGLRDGLARRFERERDILASLDHPNIATLYDAGVTPSGQPWLALEYVEGRPLTDWCDAARLGISERVHLFRQVLLAVQHAHAKLVMHRDLKPANILVAGEGEVHLLDFGIAKLFEPGDLAPADTELTRAAGRPLTPLYASPEQLRGEPLTVACDVYSLGVVLYELLCGERPYELKADTPAQIEHAILDADPRAPSRRALREDAARQRGISPPTLRKGLAGDLDAIVLHALAKQPSHRYASVEALLADLDRWLGGEPVKARAPSAVYRWGKFARRHRLGVSLGSSAVLALAVVATAAVIQGRQARIESARALAARDFMVDMFRRADPEKARGISITAGELLETGRRDIEQKLREQPDLQVDLLQGIASIQYEMADYTKSGQTFEAVEALFRRLGRTPDLVLTLTDRAENAWQLGDAAAAGTLLAQAQRLSADMAPDARINSRLAHVAGTLASDRSDHAGARALFAQAAEQAALAYGPNHIKTLKALRDLASVESDAGHHDAVLRIHADILQRVAANPAIEARQQAEFAFEHVQDLYDAGRVREALTAAESASTDCDNRVGPNAQWCRLLQQVRVQAALRLGWPGRALPALAALTAVADDSTAPAQQVMSSALLVRVLAALGRAAEVRALQGRLQGLAEAGPESAMGEHFKVTAALALADASLRLGAPGQALRWAEQALRREPHEAVSPRVFAWAHSLRGLALLELGTNDQALAALQRAGAAHRAALGENHPMTLLFSLNEARALALVGRAQEGRQLVQRAAPRLLEALGADAPTYQNLLRLQAWLAEADLPSNAARQTGSPSSRDASASQSARLLFN